ncbi:MAG: DUF1385 domain-containing protein [Lachnospiraceae bacterium]|nr:DUF1385 domain-containing protein [Lachnospiraceae bacterium]
MRYSGIGGQAVMEGVMMKNKDRYAVAVRKPDQEIVVEVKDYTGIIKNEKVKNIPILRGVLNFIDSLVLGISTLTYSASFFEEEESNRKKQLDEKQKKKKENAEMGITVALSFVLAIAIFMILPYYLSLFFRKYIASPTLLALIEGVIRLVIFVVYILLISRMEDIQRTFMYHGAEHKCINCIEHGLELNVENVRKSSRQHKRCGTSFLLYVLVLSILFFAFIRVDNRALRLLLRVALIPVIAGVSYEFIRLAGRSENKLVMALSKPGLWLQNLTTKEPDDAMIEVGIASVEAVFDWRSFQKDVEEQ